jgi:CubicO group peptidase (beta-lactamase class C family)
MSLKKIKTCVIVSLATAFMLIFQPVSAQFNFQGLETAIAAANKELGKEFVILVYKDGKVIFSKSAGEFTAKSQAPIASSSKWLTAALIMALVDDGKISLDDKISKHLPIFTKYSKGFITIRQCLSHLTGIEAEPIKLANFVKRNKYNSLEEEIEEFASKREIVSNPGLAFSYSNVGMNIAGRYIEVALKRGFEQLMQEKILRPLQMRGTNFSSLNAINPSGGAQSTANDLMNFCSMLLNKGMFNGKRVLSEESVKLLLQTQTTSAMIKYAPKSAEGYNYALGSWVLQTDQNGNATVLASPGLFGTWPMIDLCRNYAVVFFAKELLSEEKKDVYLKLKNIIDEQIVANCN